PLIRSPSTFTLDQPARMSLISLSRPSASSTLLFSIPTATRKPPTPPAIRTTRATRPMSPRRLPRPATILNRFRYADPITAAMPRSRSRAGPPRAHSPFGSAYIPGGFISPATPDETAQMADLAGASLDEGWAGRWLSRRRRRPLPDGREDV